MTNEEHHSLLSHILQTVLHLPKLMASLSDLQTAVTELNTNVAANTQAVTDLAARVGNASGAPDLTPEVAAVNAAAANVAQNTASLAAILPASPAPES